MKKCFESWISDAGEEDFGCRISDFGCVGYIYTELIELRHPLLGRASYICSGHTRNPKSDIRNPLPRHPKSSFSIISLSAPRAGNRELCGSGPVACPLPSRPKSADR